MSFREGPDGLHIETSGMPEFKPLPLPQLEVLGVSEEEVRATVQRFAEAYPHLINPQSNQEKEPMSNVGKHVKATTKENYGKRADGVPPSVLVGIVKDEVFIGDESYVTLDIDNTTTSIAVDYDEWTWEVLS